MGVKLITPPASTPVTLAEAKAHLNVVDSDYDTLITSYIQAATAGAEAYLGRALIDQTWDLYLDSFPTEGDMEIKIPKPPLIEVKQISYVKADGSVGGLVPATDYYVDSVSEPGWVLPVGGWPSTLDAVNTVTVRFRAGYFDGNSPPGKAVVPDDIRAAILLTVGGFYEQRENIVVGTIVNDLPWGVQQMLRLHRVLLGMA